MKPRFSLLFLLAFTAYVAVNIAGFSAPFTSWRYVAVILWCAMLGWAC
ncbi:MAG: hypothetical protein SGJ19_28475 [Planctomycetia bacterium]|nr:hypothetical protein [Planctomycetia bacterium]